MKNVKVAVFSLVGTLLTVQQALAGDLPNGQCIGRCDSVPEIDGSGAIIAIGLVAGLVALVREKFYNK